MRSHLTPDITRQLAGIDYQMHDAKDMALNAQQLAGFQMGDALLVALIVMLLLEQLLAYLASYHVHPPRSNRSMILAILNLLLFAQAAGMPAPQPRRSPSITQPATERVVYEISRLRNFDDERLPVALIAAAVIAIVASSGTSTAATRSNWPASRDSASCCLRLVALAGLLVFFLGIERRTTREVVHNSQVAVLVDVSQSMGLGENENATETGGTRIQAVVNALSNSPLVADLRQSHDVNVARFERDVEPVVSHAEEG